MDEKYVPKYPLTLTSIFNTIERELTNDEISSMVKDYPNYATHLITKDDSKSGKPVDLVFDKENRQYHFKIIATNKTCSASMRELDTLFGKAQPLYIIEQYVNSILDEFDDICIIANTVSGIIEQYLYGWISLFSFKRELTDISNRMISVFDCQTL
jgi:hypothetical protein